MLSIQAVRGLPSGLALTGAVCCTSQWPAGPKKTLFCVLTDELLRAKDGLLSEEGQSLSSLTAQVVR